MRTFSILKPHLKLLLHRMDTQIMRPAGQREGITKIIPSLIGSYDWEAIPTDVSDFNNFISNLAPLIMFLQLQISKLMIMTIHERMVLWPVETLLISWPTETRKHFQMILGKLLWCRQETLYLSGQTVLRDFLLFGTARKHSVNSRQRATDKDHVYIRIYVAIVDHILQ